MNTNPKVGEKWKMKRASIRKMAALPFVIAEITDESDQGWKVRDSTGWTGGGLVWGRGWFVEKIPIKH